MDLEALLKTSLRIISPAVGITFYYRNSLREVAEPVGSFYRQYLDRCGRELRWFGDEHSRRILSFDEELGRSPLAMLNDDSLTRDRYSWVVHGGVNPAAASPLLFNATSRIQNGDMSCVRATYPIDWFKDGFDPIVRAVEGVLAGGKVVHGYAGLCFNLSIMPDLEEQTIAMLVPLAMRFQGIEVDVPDRTALFMPEGIKGVNWLTYFNGELLKKLGGEKKLRSALAEPIEVRRNASGIIIQAGDRPTMGDIHQGDRLPLYRQVAKATSKIRASKHCAFGWRNGKFDAEQTFLWLHRLDN